MNINKSLEILLWFAIGDSLVVLDEFKNRSNLQNTD